MGIKIFGPTAMKPEKWDARPHLIAPASRSLWVGLMQYIPFWESGGVFKETPGDFVEDVSGNHRHGLFVGNAHYVGTTKEGRGLQRDTGGASNDYCDLSGCSDFGASGYPASWLPLKQVTVLHKHKRTGAVTDHCGFGVIGGDQTDRLGTHFPYAGVIYWDFGGWTEGTSRLSKAGTPEDDTWVFTAGPRGMEIWRNGVLWASNSGQAVRNYDPTIVFALGGMGDTWQGPGIDTAFGMWDRQLTVPEIGLLSVDPWAPVRPYHVPVSFVGAAPSADTSTLSLDAAIQALLSKTLSMDAAVQATFSDSVDLDAAVQARLAKTLDLDAAILATYGLEVALDAAIVATLTKTLSIDAAVQKTLEITAALDAAVQATLTKTVSLDAAVQATLSKATSLDGALQKVFYRFLSFDAGIAGRYTKSIDFGAAILATLTKTVDFDARLDYGRHMAFDALIGGTMTDIVSLDALLVYARQLAFDAYILAPTSTRNADRHRFKGEKDVGGEYGVTTRTTITYPRGTSPED